MDCVFCEIASKNSEAEIVFENDNYVAFLDINPVNFGHTLIVPKKHYDNFLTIPAELLVEMIKLTQFVAGAVKRALNADGFNIISNNGSSAGQSVYHFHFHIIPRFEKDFHIRPRTIEYGNSEMKNYADKIKSSLSKYEGLLNG